MLEATPAEPILLNYAGVALYELWSLDAARALFKAAERLDPSAPALRRNLRECARRAAARAAAQAAAAPGDPGARAPRTGRRATAPGRPRACGSACA